MVRLAWVGLLAAVAGGACARDNPLFGRQGGDSGGTSATANDTRDSAAETSQATQTGKAEAGEDESATHAVTDSASTTSGDSSDTDSAADDNSVDTGDICRFDLETECNAFNWNDCPQGTRCRPIDTTNDLIPDAAYCVPIADDPGQLGEECVRECGVDDCGVGLICGLGLGPGEGLCLSLCSGTALAPVCDQLPGFTCMAPLGGLYGVCALACDPLVQDCADGLVCIHGREDFGCVLDASDGRPAPGDPCDFLNQCGPGMSCGPASAVLGCEMGERCCTLYCDLAEGCEIGEDCVPVDESAPALAEVGWCLWAE